MVTGKIDPTLHGLCPFSPHSSCLKKKLTFKGKKQYMQFQLKVYSSKRKAFPNAGAGLQKKNECALVNAQLEQEGNLSMEMHF